MSEAEFDRTLNELDRLLNDPTIPMQAERIWTMLADVASRNLVIQPPAIPTPIAV